MAKGRYPFENKNRGVGILNIPLRHRVKRFFLLALLSFIFAFIYITIYSYFFDTPKAAILQAKNDDLKLKYELLLSDIVTANENLHEINQRDMELYRPIFAMQNSSHSAEILRYQENSNHLIDRVKSKLLELRYKIYLQSKSFDEVSRLAYNMEKLSRCVPSITPVDLNKVRISSPFGFRTDPVFGGVRLHQGVDFAGEIGTPVYCTGEGVVARVEYSFSGYGNIIDVEHGFGYVTRYAHLSKILVRKGMTVKRGTKIGLLGKSGKITGPHLHYEVRYNGVAVNPKNFFVVDTKDVDYYEILEVD